MSEVISTNPAQRAVNFLSEFRSAANEVEMKVHSPQVRNALAQMYNLKVSDTSFLMASLSDAWKLPVQIRESISTIGLDPSVFEHVMQDLEKVLTAMMLESNSNTVVSNIPGGLANSLEMISSVLDKDLPEAMLTNDNIEELLQDIANLESEIRSAELDKDFTDYILHRSESIKYALSHYETLGPNEVVLRVDQMFGGVLRQYQSLTNTKKKSGLISKLLKVGAAIIFAINAANGSFELSDNIHKFIDSGIQIDAEIIEGIEPDATLIAKK